jgi:hypothetical protein
MTSQPQPIGNHSADIWHSAIVSEDVLVRLVVAARTSRAEGDKLAALGCAINNDKLIPNLAPLIIDMMGGQPFPGLRESFEIDLECGDLTEDSARAFLRRTRTMIAEERVLVGVR